MIYKQFKDKKLSFLGMGNMRLPTNADGKIDYQKSQEIIDYLYRSGVNYFDTAYPYHDGESEFFVGQALRKYPRESYNIATKFIVRANPNIEEMFEHQLQKLGVNYVDFYLIHCLNDELYYEYTDPSRGYLDYLLEQKRKGRIRHIGFSSHGSCETLQKFLDYTDEWEFAQIQLNYIDWTLQDAQRQYDIITSHNIPVWVMEPVRGGKLATMNADAEALLRASEPDRSIASWAFRWLYNLDNVGIVLSGMSTLEQAKDNVKTFSKIDPLTSEQREILAKACEIFKKEYALPCTACRYCTKDCPVNIDIPKWLSLYNEYNFSHYGKLLKGLADAPNNPTQCVACGNCKMQCPQNIDVPAAMEQLTKWVTKK
jgi:predicted aldo/keto reductase-like oxidoreductase